MDVIMTQNVTVQLRSEEGDLLGGQVVVPIDITEQQLESLCSTLLDDRSVKCLFFVDDQQVLSSLGETLSTRKDSQELNVAERVVNVTYQPQAVFRVDSVTRCTSSMPGHGEAVVAVSFSPDGKYLASGSGDTTVRFWDVNTETPQFTCKGHKNWVLCISWSPDGRKLASACKNGQVIIWDPSTGQQIGQTLVGHKKWITCLVWEPLHLDGRARRLASSSKDGDVRIWDVLMGRCERVLAGHTAGVSFLRWSGEGLICSASQDRTIKVWRANDGVLCRTLEGHGHWVNTMALSTDYVLRTGAIDPAELISDPFSDRSYSSEELQAKALKRYQEAKGSGPERMVSGSDDFTLFLWVFASEKKPTTRMTGHQQLVNQVLFSPDGRYVGSASFDKSVKLWCGRTGKYITSFRGHVQAVYQIAWSADSRLLVSGSADSTLKVFDVKTKKLAIDLPGHADEVYAVDWSPDGLRVASGGKDRVLKVWRK